MTRSDVRARRESIVDFISGHERKTQVIVLSERQTCRWGILNDLKTLRESDVIVKTAADGYQLAAVPDARQAKRSGPSRE